MSQNDKSQTTMSCHSHANSPNQIIPNMFEFLLEIEKSLFNLFIMKGKLLSKKDMLKSTCKTT